jgi:hypothetical protein
MGRTAFTQSRRHLTVSFDNGLIHIEDVRDIGAAMASVAASARELL